MAIAHNAIFQRTKRLEEERVFRLFRLVLVGRFFLTVPFFLVVTLGADFLGRCVVLILLQV